MCAVCTRMYEGTYILVLVSLSVSAACHMYCGGRGRRGVGRGRGGGRRVGLMTIGVGGQWGGGPSL